jgi:tyrosine-protein phosphatase YwqE
VLDDECASVAAEVRAGTVLQLNSSSLAGRHGQGARAAAFELAQRFPVVLGSDAHGTLRPPSLCAGLRTLIGGAVAPHAAHNMLDGGPRSLLRYGLTRTAAARVA